MASAGALVVAVDLTLAGEAPYPACVQDGSYAVRWLRKNASKWKGDVSRLGLFGSSSGGHVAELLTLRPNDARYHAIPLAGGAGIKATFDYVILRSPISDTFARYDNAKQMNNASMMKNNENFFVPFETIHEGNPKEILDRAEKVAFKPMIVMQGALDTNVRPEAQAAFVDAYRNAGGQIEYVVFEGCEHEWVAEPSPQTDHAHERAKEYIAWHVAH
jgi:acetyl esterase/lipase